MRHACLLPQGAGIEKVTSGSEELHSTKVFFTKYSLVLHRLLVAQIILGDQYTPKEKRKQAVKDISPLACSQSVLPEEQRTSSAGQWQPR